MPSNDRPTFGIGFQSRYSLNWFVVLLCRSNADVYAQQVVRVVRASSPALLKLSVESRLMYWYLSRPDSVSSIVFLYSTHNLFQCDLS